MRSFKNCAIIIAALSVFGEVAYGGTCGTIDSYANTACGDDTLLHIVVSSTSGSFNSAFGDRALQDDTLGWQNTASGFAALELNTTGSDNTASGYEALRNNTGGGGNTAAGYGALFYNTTGNNNTATGWQALLLNKTGGANTATGLEALVYNTTGNSNTASGGGALYKNSTGNNNAALGAQALFSNTLGSNNIAVGYEAGYYLATGSNNIEIGNKGTGSDYNMIKIGTEGIQAKTFIAGIYATSVTGSAVMVDSSGQLGVVVSSERFKTAIAPMGAKTEKLQQLRPVTFKLKSDANGTLQYGLIAEEVARVYPELVVHDSNGRIDGVRYDELAPMLLNEIQQQQATIRTMSERQDTESLKIGAQAAEIRGLKQQVAELNDLKQELDAALRQLRSKDKLVAQR